VSQITCEVDILNIKCEADRDTNSSDLRLFRNVHKIHFYATKCFDKLQWLISFTRFWHQYSQGSTETCLAWNRYWKLYFKFIRQCASERIWKISQYLVKLYTEYWDSVYVLFIHNTSDIILVCQSHSPRWLAHCIDYLLYCLSENCLSDCVKWTLSSGVDIQGEYGVYTPPVRKIRNFLCSWSIWFTRKLVKLVPPDVKF